MKQILALVLLSVISHAETQVKTVPGVSQVHFEAVGKPSLLKIKGEGSGVDGKFNVNQNKVSGTANFPLDQLKTGIDLRDEHMKEKYLETKKFPSALLSLSEVSLPNDYSVEKPRAAEVPFSGKLSLHGVDKPIEGVLKLGDDLSAQAAFEIKLSDYNIELPNYLGVKVADIVKVKVQLNKMEVLAK